MRIQIRIGGSHRKFNKQVDALQEFSHGLPIRYKLYGKMFHLVVTDTPEVREIVTRVGAKITREQPDYLNEP